VSGIYNGPNYEGVWNPITRALSSAELKTVRFRVATFGVTGNTQILPGLQWSDDGVNWTSAAAAFTGDSWLSATDGWDFTAFQEWRDIWTNPSSPTKRLFVRFGLFVRSSHSAVANVSADAELIVEAAPVIAGTLVTPPTRVAVADSGTWVVWRLSDWMPSAGLNGVRVTASLEGVVTPVQWEEILIQADDPMDLSTWSNLSFKGGTTTTSSSGIVYGSTFTELSGATLPTKRYVAFAIKVRQVSGLAYAPLTMTLRVDARGFGPLGVESEGPSTQDGRIRWPISANEANYCRDRCRATGIFRLGKTRHGALICVCNGETLDFGETIITPADDTGGSGPIISPTDPRAM
jgi:hypothetical protein